MRADTKSLGSPGEQQGLVDQRFRASVYWREIYRRRDVYAIIHQLRREAALALVESLHLPASSRVLDLGCGVGTIAVALAERGYRVTAVDTVDSMLNLTRGLARQLGVADRVSVSRSDAHSLAFAAETFDLIVALGVVPFLHSLPHALREVARVLRPEAFFVASADNRWRLNHLLDPTRFPPLAPARRRARETLEQLGLWKQSNATVRPRMHSRPEFDQLLHSACLEVRQRKTLGFGPFSLLNLKVLPERVGIKLHEAFQSLADRGYPLLGRAGAQYIVMAEKVRGL